MGFAVIWNGVPEADSTRKKGVQMRINRQLRKQVVK